MAIVLIRLFIAGFLFFLADRIYDGVASASGDYETATVGQTARAEGTVTAVLRSNGNRRGDTVSQTVEVVFSTSTGAPERFEPSLVGSNARVGMKVPVRYDPDNPNRSSVVPATEPTRLLMPFYLVAALFAFGGIANVWALRRPLQRLWNSR